MYGQLEENGRVINLCSMQLADFSELPEGTNVGDFIVKGKVYSPPNSYSILSTIKNGTPVWTEDADAKNAEMDMQRRAAYAAESDPLFFKEQRGEVDAGTWAAKVAEIKARFSK